MSVPDEQHDFIFRPQQHLDAKWLNPDLQDALHSSEALCAHFNTLLQDRELYYDAANGLVNAAGITTKLGDSGKYYCGLRVRKKRLKSYEKIRTIDNDNNLEGLVFPCK